MFQNLKFPSMPVNEYRLSRQRRDFHDGLPSSLPNPRSPAPSLSLSPSNQVQNQIRITKQQTDSLLLARLPAEIRVLIWEFAIGGQKLHIISKYRRLGHAVCDEAYWAECRAERPGLTASSYLYTYGSLPTTLRLAEWSMCSLLVVCKQIYTEAVSLLYSTNSFVFWDLRTIPVFRASILPSRWSAIRTVEVYAMYYRKEDIDDAVESRSLLQLEVWPSTCRLLRTLPDVRRIRIFVGSTTYLSLSYLKGGRGDAYMALLGFLKECRVNEGIDLEVFLSRRGGTRDCTTHWNTTMMKDEVVRGLEGALRKEGVCCNVYDGDVDSGEEEIERRLKNYLIEET